MLDPRLLRTFLAVCRSGSISGAARTLNVSQPAVSVAIAQLERGLDSTLLARSRQGVTPTPAGVALMRRAEMQEALLADAQEAVALAKTGVRGPLRVGGTPGALVSLLPGAVARLEAQGSLSLTVVEATDATLADLLRRGEIEVAIVTTEIEPPPPDISEVSIARDPFALIVGRAHEALGARVTLRELMGLGWVLPRAAGAFHRQIQALFLAAEIPYPADVIRCDSLLASKAIVRQGRRVTLLPRGVVASELSMGVLRAVHLSEGEITRSIGIRTLRGVRPSTLATQFLAAIGVVVGHKQE